MAITVDSLINLSPRNKLLILVGVLLLIGYLYFMYLLQPALAERSQLKENYENLQRQIESRQQVMKQIEQHKKDIAELQKNLQTAIAKLPEQKEIPGLLVAISDAEKEEGLENLLFKPSEPVPKDFYKEIPVSVIVMGGYHDIASFFGRIATLPRIVNITEFEVQRSKAKGAASHLLSAKCLLKTYMFMEPTEEEKTADEEKQT
ncbi:MAG: type 4a pilus biogenesis protein PilO [Deltaproteobacteria bacterium]|nr:type 4a pilus biogenesis protein PilO [Deltaproteobacteria bacterium]